MPAALFLCGVVKREPAWRQIGTDLVDACGAFWCGVFGKEPAWRQVGADWADVWGFFWEDIV
jgi:hypothetical protein